MEGGIRAFFKRDPRIEVGQDSTAQAFENAARSLLLGITASKEVMGLIEEDIKKSLQNSVDLRSFLLVIDTLDWNRDMKEALYNKAARNLEVQKYFDLKKDQAII